MMEMCGPESFTGPIAHQLFIGFRPLVVRMTHPSQLLRVLSIKTNIQVDTGGVHLPSRHVPFFGRVADNTFCIS